MSRWAPHGARCEDSHQQQYAEALVCVVTSRPYRGEGLPGLDEARVTQQNRRAWSANDRQTKQKPRLDALPRALTCCRASRLERSAKRHRKQLRELCLPRIGCYASWSMPYKSRHASIGPTLQETRQDTKEEQNRLVVSSCLVLRPYRRTAERGTQKIQELLLCVLRDLRGDAHVRETRFTTKDAAGHEGRAKPIGDSIL